MCSRAAIGAPFSGKSRCTRFVSSRGCPMQWHVVAITTRRAPRVMHEQLSAGPPSCALGQARDGVSPAFNQLPVTCVLTQSTFSSSWFKTTVVCDAELLGAPPAAPFSFYPIPFCLSICTHKRLIAYSSRGCVTRCHWGIMPLTGIRPLTCSMGCTVSVGHSGPSVILG